MISRLVCVLLALGVCAAWGSPGASAQAPASPANQLVSTYLPIVKLRKDKTGGCSVAKDQSSLSVDFAIGGGSPEDFKPTTVDTVLGNPSVELVDRAGRLIKRAPTAADVARLGPSYHLNLGGDPLEPGCFYADAFAGLERSGKAPTITYAHLAREPGVPGLVVQYWFFYYFNQFNDLHEGDWEGMQIAFRADTAAGALAQGPFRIALFQHGGGESARWNDYKVQTQGTHPVVYVAAGSHATFFEPAVYVENGGGGAGLGCDVATEPMETVHPTPVLVPTHPSSGSPFAWVNFRGHWGRKEKGFNNGPQGPATKTQWLRPFTWMRGANLASPKLPNGFSLGAPATTVFCGAVAVVSEFVNLESRSRFVLVIILGVLIVLIALPVVLTHWRPVDVTILRQRRPFGQLIRATRQLYGRHWRALVPIGLTAAPIIGAVYGLEWLLREAPGRSAVTTWLAGAIGSLGRSIGYAVIAAVVITFVRQLDEQTESPGFVAAYRDVFRRFWRVVTPQVLVNVLVSLLALTIVGIPFAIWKFVDWQFVQQRVVFENDGVRESLRGSSRLVRHQWWRTVGVAAVLWLLGVALGPVLGFFLVFASVSPVAIDVIGSIVYALLIPYVAVGRTLLYFDLLVRKPEAAGVRKPLLRLWRRLRSRPESGYAGQTG